MKITALSDAHAKVIDLSIPPTDVLIYAGDWSNGGSMSETSRFIYWMSKQPAKYKIAVAGNHDIFCEQSDNLAKEMFASAEIYYLKDEGVAINGVRFYGTPWCVPFMNWAFMRSEEWMEKAFRAIPFNLDFLICHTPPKGILDNCGGKNIGSQSLYDRILFTTPKNVIFGHMHSNGKATMEVDKKLINFYNVAVCNEKYDIVKEPTEIYYEYSKA